jgi:hypothetical protein
MKNQKRADRQFVVGKELQNFVLKEYFLISILRTRE